MVFLHCMVFAMVAWNVYLDKIKGENTVIYQLIYLYFYVYYRCLFTFNHNYFVSYKIKKLSKKSGLQPMIGNAKSSMLKDSYKTKMIK